MLLHFSLSACLATLHWLLVVGAPRATDAMMPAEFSWAGAPECEQGGGGDGTWIALLAHRGPQPGRAHPALQFGWLWAAGTTEPLPP